MTKSFEDIRAEVNEAKSNYKDIESWVNDKLENTDMDSTKMKSEFDAKFGKGSTKDYEKAVAAFMD
jgi:hypothetical protein